MGKQRRGGKSGIIRKRYSVLEKLQLLNECGKLQRECNMTARSAALEMGIHHTLLVRWRDETNLENMIRGNKKNKKSLHVGPDGVLLAVQDELHNWLFSKREQGIAIVTSHLVYKAAALLDATSGFKEKTFEARFKVVSRWLSKFSYVYRMRTNEATRPPHAVREEALEFLVITRPMLAGPHRDRRWIFNMDQTPLFFSYHRMRTLAKKGSKSVHVRKSNDDTRRCTAALTCTASGEFLRPMIVYKGQPGKHIATRELPLHDPTSHYACQVKGWMDEIRMQEWVHVVLAAYIADTPPPPGIVPVILLDAYRVHMCQAVVDSIQALGIEVIHIPGGCTGMLQPLDVGINRPYKVRIRAKWEEWMMDTIDRYGEIRPPTREDVSAWAAETHWEMQGLPLMQNAWRKTDYSWFPNDDPAGANIILGDSFTDDEIAEEEEDEIAIMMDEIAEDEEDEEDEFDRLIGME